MSTDIRNRIREYCERCCRCASQLGAELHQTRLPGGLFVFTFIMRDGARHEGQPASNAEAALHSACKAFADAVL